MKIFKKIFKTSRQNLATTSKRNSFEHHLEIKIREGTSEADLAAIVTALAAISNFFGVKCIKGGGGSGGKSPQRFRPIRERPKMGRRKKIRPEIEIPGTPDSRPEYRVGGSQ